MSQGKKIKDCSGVGKKEDYQLIEPPLGVGGFAKTYKGKVLSEELKERFGDYVAIKVPLSDEHIRYLIQELMNHAAMQLKSKFIIEFYEFNILDKMPVMVMELANHGSLRNKIGEVGEQEPIDIDDALLISDNICEGLKFAHDADVFHRDIKPENILISMVSDDQFIAKVGDFGISRVLKSREYPSKIIGTPYYMAREVFEGQGRLCSDIYSVGVVMYEMMTGELPFDGPTPEIVKMQIYTKKPTPPMEINRDIDRELNDIILKAMHSDMNARYATIDVLLKDIKDYRARRGMQGGKSRVSDRVAYESSLAGARKLYDEGGRDEYENALKGMIKQYPREPEAYAYLGAYYNLCNRAEDAKRIFEEGISNVPRSASLHRDLAFVYYATGQKSHAIELLSTACERADNDGMKKKMMSLLNVWDSKQEKKSRPAKTAVAAEAKNAGVVRAGLESSISLLKRRYEEGVLDEYEKELRGLISKYPDDHRAYAYLGEYFNRCKRYEEAISILRDGIMNNPAAAVLSRDIAFSFYGARRRKEAIDAMEKAVELATDASFERQAGNILKLWRAESL